MNEKSQPSQGKSIILIIIACYTYFILMYELNVIFLFSFDTLLYSFRFFYIATMFGCLQLFSVRLTSRAAVVDRQKINKYFVILR